MSAIPLSTQFVGFSENVNLTEKRSALINSETATVTMQDIVDTVGEPTVNSYIKIALDASIDSTPRAIADDHDNESTLFVSDNICKAEGDQFTAVNGLKVGADSILDASAIADFASTTKGVLLPTMTTAEINAIVSPALGLVVYNTTLDCLCWKNSVRWVKVSHSNM